MYRNLPGIKKEQNYEAEQLDIKNFRAGKWDVLEEAFISPLKRFLSSCGADTLDFFYAKMFEGRGRKRNRDEEGQATKQQKRAWITWRVNNRSGCDDFKCSGKWGGCEALALADLQVLAAALGILRLEQGVLLPKRTLEQLRLEIAGRILEKIPKPEPKQEFEYVEDFGRLTRRERLKRFILAYKKEQYELRLEIVGRYMVHDLYNKYSVDGKTHGTFKYRHFGFHNNKRKVDEEELREAAEELVEEGVLTEWEICLIE
jgi:hypothetical protein